MPTNKHTTGERWKQFLAFIVVWVLAAGAGSALLFYLTADPDPPPPEIASVVEDEPAPRVAAAPMAEPLDASPSAPFPDAVAEEARSQPASPPRPAASRAATSAEDNAEKVASLIRSAAAATEAGNYEAAIRDYESALAIDPNNFEIEILMSQVDGLLALDARDTDRRFEASRTEITASGRTVAATDADIIIELLPQAPNPGDPYVLRVRAHNLSDDFLTLSSIELVDTHDSLKHERGRAIAPLARRLGPKENALLLERKSDWSVADRRGRVVVVVTLADGSRLSKSLQW